MSTAGRRLRQELPQGGTQEKAAEVHGDGDAQQARGAFSQAGNPRLGRIERAIELAAGGLALLLLVVVVDRLLRRQLRPLDSMAETATAVAEGERATRR